MSWVSQAAGIMAGPQAPTPELQSSPHVTRGSTIELLQWYFWLGMVILITWLVIAPICCCSEARRTNLRHLGFMLLHVTDYWTNILTMLIFATDAQLRSFLCILLPTHIIVGCFCTYIAIKNETMRQWQCPAVLKWPFVVIGLGLMQGVQVQLTWRSYKAHTGTRGPTTASEADVEMAAQVEATGERSQAPALMPARFHCKAMDGLFEGSIFAYVIFLVLTDSPMSKAWEAHITRPMDMTSFDWMRQQTLQISLLFSIFTCGFALMDLDYRTSVVVQRKITKSLAAQYMHFTFRISEVVLRMITTIVLCFCIRKHFGIWWGGYVIITLDYMFGVSLLMFIGWHDPVRKAGVLLGCPLLVANVVQFTDVPVLAYQARRLSRILLPVRTMQLLIIIAMCFITTPWEIRPGGCGPPPPPGVPPPPLGPDCDTKKVAIFLARRHPGVLLMWSLSGVTYYLLYVIYARRTKPVADLYSAVSDGDVENLRSLLQGSGLVLDVNRCGPDGRTPLHIAVLRSHVECFRLLVREGANLYVKTADGHQNNILHLAAAQKNPRALRLLLEECGGNAVVTLANTTNARGDTPLHVAARRHNVEALRELLVMPGMDIQVRNEQGLTPSESVVSKKFNFDYRSTEHDITVLFQDIQAGLLSQSNVGNTNSSSFPSSIETGLGLSCSTSTIAKHQQLVPLVSVPLVDEDAFMTNFASTSLGSSEALAREPGPVCGVSSFMLSSGLGALSQVFSGIIQQDDCTDGSTVGGDADLATFEPMRVQDFQVVQSIGKGSFGRVELVEHRETKEQYAMKLLERQKYAAQRITRFAFSEQYILKTTRHPLIVSLHFAFQTTRHWVMVMEYCPGGNLMDRLMANGDPGLQPGVCARIGGEILLAIEHLHRIRVIFRDVKPENIVFDGKGRSKVTDFGLAKKLGPKEMASTACGTEGYAAPELITRSGKYSFAVDIYSLGVLMYVIVTGGHKSSREPKRLPPQSHVALRNYLFNLPLPAPLWAAPQLGAHSLLLDLTKGQSAARPTASEVKEHTFFKYNLGHSVDDLMPSD